MKITITTNPSLVKIALPYHRFNKAQLDAYFEILVKIFHKNIVNSAPSKTGVGRKAIVARKKKYLEWDVLIDQRLKGGNYMTWQHEGVPADKINPILPRQKKALWWPGLAHPVKAVYHHPGIKANPFFATGIAAGQAEVNAKSATIETEIAKQFE